MKFEFRSSELCTSRLIKCMKCCRRVLQRFHAIFEVDMAKLRDWLMALVWIERSVYIFELDLSLPLNQGLYSLGQTNTKQVLFTTFNTKTKHQIWAFSLNGRKSPPKRSVEFPFWDSEDVYMKTGQIFDEWKLVGQTQQLGKQEAFSPFDINQIRRHPMIFVSDKGITQQLKSYFCRTYIT